MAPCHLLRHSLLVMALCWPLSAEQLLIPMDDSQLDHLKAYGLVYQVLQAGGKAEVLLNYRAGSFTVPATPAVVQRAAQLNVTTQPFSAQLSAEIDRLTEKENIARLPLEKAPRIAIYKPPGTDPWDDAVQLALDYAEIPYQRLWDEEVLQGRLVDFDWLHLHHEDFTGQYGKFYGYARNMHWYQARRLEAEALARRLGYQRVADQKKDIALAIQKFTADGGFLFAMCSATDSLDVALAAQNIDIVDPAIDHTPLTPDYQKKLEYDKTFAFTNFAVITDPNIYEFADIDINPQRDGLLQHKDFFTLFEFNARIDPIPTLLTQNHRREIKGFLGQTTAFRLDKLKPRVLILGQTLGTDRVKYIYGSFGKGFFTFYGGHDPEDYQHMVGDPPTDLSLHRNSPGYRLILNNIFMPAAKKQKLKT